jgi:hypothetical protein
MLPIGSQADRIFNRPDLDARSFDNGFFTYSGFNRRKIGSGRRVMMLYLAFADPRGFLAVAETESVLGIRCIRANDGG